MRTLRRYRITALVALIAFLPVVYRAFPELALSWQVAVALAVALLAGYVEHQRSVAPQLSLADKRTYLFASACEPALEDLRRRDPTARLNIMEVDRKVFERFGSFEPVYTLGMEGDEDKDLRLRLRRGCAARRSRTAPSRRPTSGSRAARRSASTPTSSQRPAASPWS